MNKHLDFLKDHEANHKTIYVTHTTAFDYQKNLYQPLRKSLLSKCYQFYLPHESNIEPQNTKEIIRSADLILAEVSNPSTGQGIELGWASLYHIPIICVFEKSKNYSTSLQLITNSFIPYADTVELIEKLEGYLLILKLF